MPFQIRLLPLLKVQRMMWLGLPLWWELGINPISQVLVNGSELESEYFTGDTSIEIHSPGPMNAKSTVLLNISQTDFFCLVFYLKWNYFVLIDHILSKNICLFCFCVLFSKMYPKIKFMAKNWSDLCNFYNKVIFWNSYLRKYFLLFFAEFEFLVFHNNIVKIPEKLNKQNLLKICLPVTYPTNFCRLLHSILLWEKVKIFVAFFLKKNWQE